MKHDANPGARVLLLSAYDALSHRRWREGLTANLPQFSWTVLHLPPRYFNWRIRGNALSWSRGQWDVLNHDYDLVVATSMTDVASLRGLVPKLANTPCVVYFHENQFTYPVHKGAPEFLEPKMVNLYSALAADCLVFNSDYNRQSFFTGVQNFLNRMPDAVPQGVVESLAGGSAIIPVPLEQSCFVEGKKAEVFTIVWNHRWEYDKAPERFFAALSAFANRGVEFRLHVLGQRFRSEPDVFRKAKAEFALHIDTWGFAEDESAYRRCLMDSHVVVSSALHDFQGLSMLEAVAAGCTPIVPDRLAYPEFFPPEYCYRGDLEDPEEDILAMEQALWNTYEAFNNHKLTCPSVDFLDWPTLATEYADLFSELISTSTD